MFMSLNKKDQWWSIRGFVLSILSYFPQLFAKETEATKLIQYLRQSENIDSVEVQRPLILILANCLAEQNVVS